MFRNPAINLNPGLSVTTQAIKRVQILRVFGVSRVRSASYIRPALQKLRSLKGSALGRRAVIAANGHSSSTLDSKKLAHEIRNGLDFFAMNSFFDSKLASEITPTHFVLSDGAHHPNFGSHLGSRVWKKLEDSPGVQVIVPHHWYPSLRDKWPDVTFFNDLGLEGWTRNISPTRPRGYVSLTAYKALAVALHLGYSEIFIIGFDNTGFRNFTVGAGGEILYGGATHFYSSNTPQRDLSGEFPQGFPDVLFDYSLAMLDLDRFFLDPRIVNLDPSSNSRTIRRFAKPGFLTEGIHSES